MGRGGGYRPHDAPAVFQKNYGDCKDKANLMRTMLKAVGVDSYPVAIYSGDPMYVRSEWPSPQQFNHAIIGIKVPVTVEGPAILQHPVAGRLLVFDPTDQETPVGYLPELEQDSLALLVAGKEGDLVRMPAAPPSANSTGRQVDVALAADGTVAVHMVERRLGQAAIAARRVYKGLPRSDYRRRIEKWISNTAKGAAVTSLDVKDTQEGEFTLELSFTSPRYGQLMQNRLLIFRPSVVPAAELPSFGEAKREHTVILNARRFEETVRIQIPPGFKVDELPGPASTTAPFGAHTARWNANALQAEFTHSCELRRSRIPAADYSSVRDFFGQVYGAAQTPIVLARE